MNHVEGPYFEKRRILLETIDRFQHLEEDWDSYGGVPTRADVAKKAIEIGLALIPVERNFDIVPTSQGGVQIEWHRDGLDVEISVEPHE